MENNSGAHITPLPVRHVFRAQWDSYNDGIYFVTVCTRNQNHYFGNIVDNEMYLTAVGQRLEQCIIEINERFPYAKVLNHVVMPNHFHAVVEIKNVPLRNSFNKGCLKTSKRTLSLNRDSHFNSGLGVVVGQLKGAVSRWARKNGFEFAWQQRFHEHIIRTGKAFENIMAYIDSNIVNWNKDCFYRE